MTLRYAIIGSGMMGCEHMRNIALLPDATVTAVADTDEGMRQRATALGADLGMGEVAAYSDYRALLSADVADVYVIVTPNDTHHQVTGDVMATGKPILLEKPAATVAADAWDLVRRAENRAAPIWVAMEYRYMPPVARIIDEAHNGTAGRLRMISIVEHRFPFLQKVGDWNRFSVRTGGTLVEKCCHFFDLMRLIARSEPVRVYASGAQDVNHRDERYDGRTPDILDNAFVIVDFANGMRAALDLCMFAEGAWWQEHVSVIGDAGKLEAFVPGPSRFWPGGEERASEVVISPRADKAPIREEVHVDPTILAAGDHHGSTFYQHQRFAAIIRGGGTPDVTLRDGAISVEVGLAAHKSIETGLPVAITLP